MNKNSGECCSCRFDSMIQNITISVDLGRESLDELGRIGPYHKYIKFPVEETFNITISGVKND